MVKVDQGILNKGDRLKTKPFNAEARSGFLMLGWREWSFCSNANQRWVNR